MIIWQDILIMVGEFALVAALVPAVKSKEKPPWTTSLTSGIILASFAVAFGTLHLVLASISTGLVAAMWFVLFFQRVKLRRR